jgi:hypothetical protein
MISKPYEIGSFVIVERSDDKGSSVIMGNAKIAFHAGFEPGDTAAVQEFIKLIIERYDNDNNSPSA